MCKTSVELDTDRWQTGANPGILLRGRCREFGLTIQKLRSNRSVDLFASDDYSSYSFLSEQFETTMTAITIGFFGHRETLCTQPGTTESLMTRQEELNRFYELLGRLETNVGGKRRLENCDGYMNWPDRGVYFFFADDERRENGDSLRLTRIGTHAVSAGSGTSLWNRLRNHRGALSGSYEGGGNHRGSVFRKAVGNALINRHDLENAYPEWGVGSSAGRERRLQELDMERRISDYIRKLPFLWVDVDDEPGPDSDRAYIERNAIALVSNYNRKSIDPRNGTWLGLDSPDRRMRESGLWNSNHVDESHDSGFLDLLEATIQETAPP